MGMGGAVLLVHRHVPDLIPRAVYNFSWVKSMNIMKALHNHALSGGAIRTERKIAKNVKRTMSAATRAKISKAAKKRWADEHKQIQRDSAALGWRPTVRLRLWITTE
jgi:hypothetical protein